ncbi:spore germination protein [Geobacillus genomosp. 3]|uniref:Spore germination protein n=1 Tax=Geobacillus genomosp. 3 TaxID=1921421 RepID=S6A0E4_GEOG3|nr:endospore germination permease [Geobacillus genomosp. 3]AGT31081.1 spore germination protein [Geobacillus genomosp. 3]
MNGQPLNVIQLLSVIMLSTGLMNHVLVIPILLEASHRDAWIAAAADLLILPIWLLLLYFVIKQTNGQPLFEWLSTQFSPIIAYAVAFISTIFLLVHSFVTLFDTVTFTTTSYLPATPRWALIVAITGLCFYSAYRGIQSIANVSLILLSFVTVFGFFVMLSTMQHKDHSLLKPMLEHGWMPVLHGMAYAGAGYTEVIMLLFITHRLPNTFSWKSLLMIAIFTGSLSIGPTIGAITEFGPEQATRLRYPAFEQWRLVNLGTYIEHVDFLSVHQWLSGAFIRISLFTALIVELFPIQHRETRRWVLMVVYLAIISAALVPIGDDQFFHFVKHWVLPSSLVFSLSLSVLLSLLGVFSHLQQKRRSS